MSRLAALFFLIYCFNPNLAFSSQPSSEAPDHVEKNDNLNLRLEDCQKCHHNIVYEINVNGSAHKEKVTCLNCHEGHPPLKRDIIPRCNKCHEKAPHFQLEGCSTCHTNPHFPLDISLTRDITFPCTTCHETQIAQLKEYPSIHTTLDCTACHIKHGYIPECLACHKPHLGNMTNKDCLDCHMAHKPLAVSYGANIPSEFCGGCHTTTYIQLGESKAKHRKVACVLCHEAKHKMIPKCQKCHEAPHSKSIHEKFKTCGPCHGKAHNLTLNKNEIYLENN